HNLSQVSRQVSRQDKTFTQGQADRKPRGGDRNHGRGQKAEVITGIQTRQVSQRQAGSATGNQSTGKRWKSLASRIAENNLAMGE
ncbi:hypothetical protein LDENG_00057500, partial [Lucifuga dentata]